MLDTASPGSSPQPDTKDNTSAIKVTHRSNIIPNPFSVCAAQSWLLFKKTGVNANFKNEELAMVQAPSEPKNRGWEIIQRLHVRLRRYV